MAVVKRRSGYVDHQRRLLAEKLVHGTTGVHGVVVDIPQVFADGQRDARTGDIDAMKFPVRLEGAVFIKDVVGGQQGLVDGIDDLAIADYSGGVEQVFSG